MTTPYTTGSITLTNGSAVVTGVGTAWQTALIAGGTIYVEADGNPLPILTVDTNTKITAAIKWKGASGAYPYAIMRDTAYGQQTVTNAQALSTYLQRLDNASLSAIASLVPAADKLPYFTGAGAAVLTDIKAKGRDVLAADTMLSLLGKLGPVNGGVASPVPSNADVGLLDGNFDAMRVPGTYNITGDWVNGFSGPAAATYAGWLHVFSRGSQVYQEFVQASNLTPTRWTRFTASTNSWPNAWRDITPLAFASTAEIANANLPGRLRSVPATILADVHSISEDGFYACNSATANIPEGAQGSIFAVMISATTGWIIWTRTSNGSSYMKWVNAGVWSGWAKIGLQDRGNTWAGTQTLDSGGGYLQWQLARGAVTGSFEAGTNFIGIGATSNHPLTFKMNNVERARFESANGDLLVGLTETPDPTTGSTTGFAIRGNTGRAWRRASGYNPFFQTRLATDGVVQEFFRENTAVGSISVSGTNTAYTTSSDYRLKHDVQPIVTFSLTPEQFDVLDDAELKIMALRPVFHRWNNAPEKGVVTGFIAHEAQQVVPHAVTGKKDEMVDVGREIIPAHDVDRELGDEDGNTQTVTITVPEVVNEGVRRDALAEGAEFEKTGEVPVFQTMDYGLITADIVAALQCVIHKTMLQGEEIDALTMRTADLRARIEALEGTGQPA